MTLGLLGSLMSLVAGFMRFKPAQFDQSMMHIIDGTKASLVTLVFAVVVMLVLKKGLGHSLSAPINSEGSLPSLDYLDEVLKLNISIARLDLTLNKVLTEENLAISSVASNISTSLNTQVYPLQSEDIKAEHQTLLASIRTLQQELNHNVFSLKFTLEKTLTDVFTQQATQMDTAHKQLEDKIHTSLLMMGELMQTHMKRMDAQLEDELNKVLSELAQSLILIFKKFTEDYSQLTTEMRKVVVMNKDDQLMMGSLFDKKGEMKKIYASLWLVFLA